MDEKRTKKCDVIEYVIESLEIKDRSEVLMIGDRFYDIEGAAKCGINSIGVTYGYGSYEELKNAGATYVVDCADEILEIL